MASRSISWKYHKLWFFIVLWLRRASCSKSCASSSGWMQSKGFFTVKNIRKKNLSLRNVVLCHEIWSKDHSFPFPSMSALSFVSFWPFRPPSSSVFRVLPSSFSERWLLFLFDTNIIHRTEEKLRFPFDVLNCLLLVLERSSRNVFIIQ